MLSNVYILFLYTFIGIVDEVLLSDWFICHQRGVYCGTSGFSSAMAIVFQLRRRRVQSGHDRVLGVLGTGLGYGIGCLAFFTVLKRPFMIVIGHAGAALLAPLNRFSIERIGDCICFVARTYLITAYRSIDTLPKTPTLPSAASMLGGLWYILFRYFHCLYRPVHIW